MKLALGTAQFGSDYGIANSNGSVPEGEIQEILELSRKYKIDTIDTAPLYGDAEIKLGRLGVTDFKVVSKVPPLGEEFSAANLMASVEKSLRDLRVDCLYGLLLHRSEDLSGKHGDEIFLALQDLKSQKLVKKIGISCYYSAQISGLLKDHDIDLIQFPYNVFDRRFETEELVALLKTRKIEVHSRSVFLQGLLLMDETEIPDYFHEWRSILTEWNQWVTEANLTRVDAACGFVCASPMIDRVIVGIDSAAQLEQLIEAGNQSQVSVPDSFSMNSVGLIDPRHWKLG